ncbi:MAG TPA: flagellar hook-length control protein FliK, partial [Candidatus Angelobacter sp.]|nr:flagellar hook-length control protein FliK [Candidatus Angelobacter sp.]
KADPAPASAKISGPKFSASPEKPKHENLGIDFNKKTDSRETTQPVPQVQNANIKAENQSADTKNQDPSQAQQGHSNSDTKKDSSAAQFQAPADTGKNSSEPNSAAMQQNNFSAIAQAASHNGSNSPVHMESSTSSQPLNVREAGNVSGPEATPRIVHAARLMEAAGQAEMRVSVKSEVAGSIDVRAMLQGEHISATVAAQHGGTRDWLTANMHELQASLSKDDLNLKTFEVTDSSLQNNGRGAQSHSQEQQQQNKGTYLPFENETHSAATNLEDMEVQENSSRALSLLA